MYRSVMKIAFSALVASSFTLSAETKIERSALPPSVQKTMQQQSQGATVKGYSMEHENGQTLYEAEMMVSGHSRDIEVAKDGTLMEVEEQVEMASLPPAVIKSLNARAAGATITKVESLTKQNKVVAYEAATLKGTRKGEVQVGPNGERLSREE